MTGEFGIDMSLAYFPQGMAVMVQVNLHHDGMDGVYILVRILRWARLPFRLWAMTRKRQPSAKA